MTRSLLSTEVRISKFAVLTRLFTSELALLSTSHSIGGNPEKHTSCPRNNRIVEAKRPDRAASRRVENGDVAGAHELLAAAEDGSHGLVSFALAETYDPNMLAACSLVA
jgi:hypothetical protein